MNIRFTGDAPGAVDSLLDKIFRKSRVYRRWHWEVRFRFAVAQLRAWNVWKVSSIIGRLPNDKQPFVVGAERRCHLPPRRLVWFAPLSIGPSALDILQSRIANQHFARGATASKSACAFILQLDNDLPVSQRIDSIFDLIIVGFGLWLYTERIPIFLFRTDQMVRNWGEDCRQ